MANEKKPGEFIPNLSRKDARFMMGQILNRTDGNHPHLSQTKNGFIDILENRKPDISASPIFIKKVSASHVSQAK